MTQDDYTQLLVISNRRINSAPKAFHRYLFDLIDWNDRLISIIGPRGCGKTTMMLQFINERIKDRNSAFYFSLDNLWFSSNDVKDFVDYLYTHGVRHIFIDEVHYYPLWQRLIKNLYDEYPDMKITFTGSSMLQIDHAQADLSRRLITYRMPGLSFREYLIFEGVCNINPIPFDDLIQRHIELAAEASAHTSILPSFEKYCISGYYPYYKEAGNGYSQRLNQVINQVLEIDYPAIDDVSVATTRKIRKMLMILAESVPQVVNMSSLFRELETDRNQGLKMLNALQRSGLVNLLSDEVKSLKRMSKPDKIYLNNPNLMYALTARVNIGTLRETFFLNQLQAVGEVIYPKQGDFLINNRFLFEVGGRGKNFTQIKDQPDSFLALDGIETGQHNRIPLWLFGFLY